MRLEPGPFKTSSPEESVVHQSWRKITVYESSEERSGQAAVSGAGFVKWGLLVLSLEEKRLWPGESAC